jgi:hypothetical protein
VIIYRSTGVVSFAQGEMASSRPHRLVAGRDFGGPVSLLGRLRPDLVISFAGSVASSSSSSVPSRAPVLTIVLVTLGFGIAMFGLAA